ncbi:penicillin-binding protein 1A [Labilibacter marinus]|uniref:penicillin-binding protein 1A n=1 Tax=Labilibacter marinus TaxID=1477105 RepID=UPI00094FC348|nr:transglycosylase domain-containing protein [Labilibacter marinus]
MTKKRATSKKKKTSAKAKKNSLKKKMLLLALKSVGLLLGVGFIFLLFIYLGVFGRLPNNVELAEINNDVASEVYTENGVLMGKFYYQNRLSIENQTISQHAKNALVATEDKRFFQHEGFDIVSLGRVVFKTVLLRNKAQGGGSTISQQLAKNLYGRKRYGPFSILVNKSKEIFIASRLEDVYSKEEILTLYLNTVPFGEDVYGIEAASQRFFSKHSSDLKPNEAAVLIGMLAANTAYNPRLNPKRSVKRRNVVLGRMNEFGFLNDKETEKYKQSDLGLKYLRMDHNTGIAPYFRDAIRKEVEAILEEEYGDHYNIYKDGLKIYTTIDPTLQRYADEAVQQHMASLQKEFKLHWKNRDPWKNRPSVFEKELRSSRRYKALKAAGKSEEEIIKEMKKLTKMSIFAYPHEKEVNLSPLDSVKHYLKILNTGFMVMDPKSGKILSWVGGVNHEYFKYDHVTSKRQVGSTFKPIVYTAALQNGMTPCEYISNERRIYEDYNDWSPTNSDGNHLGYYSMKGGLSNSVNTITAEVMMKTGIDKVLNLAERMGVESKLPMVPSMSLGAGEISLREMLTVYTCYANSGKKKKLVGLLRIEDKTGKVLYEYKPPIDGFPVLDRATADLMNYMLQGVITNGTGRDLRSVYRLRSQIAGKTGTTQDNADGWFIGYNPSLLAGAWVGAESPVVHFRTTSLGQGAHMALPIYGLFMKKVEGDPKYRKYTNARFSSLDGNLTSMVDCADYSEDDPDKSFFDIFGKRSKRIDSLTLKKSKQKQKEHKEVRTKKRKGLLNRMKDLFKKD